MGLPYIFFLAFGLSMDAFAVSISSGAKAKYRILYHALVIAFFFGAFQALMPAIGWFTGLGLRNLIASVDHWIACGLLTLLGGKMIYETFNSAPADEPSEKQKAFSLTLSMLLTLSVATSIDALAVGFSMSCIKTTILLPITIIGVVTFLISAMGVLIGNKCGEVFGKKFEFIGGVILIAIGVKILLSHIC